MVPMPSFVSISIRMACGTRPSMIKTRCTPKRMASMQQVTFGSMPPLMTPDSMSCSASAVWMTGMSVLGSSLSRRIPLMSVMAMRLSAPSSPAMRAAAVSALML